MRRALPSGTASLPGWGRGTVSSGGSQPSWLKCWRQLQSSRCDKPCVILPSQAIPIDLQGVHTCSMQGASLCPASLIHSVLSHGSYGSVHIHLCCKHHVAYLMLSTPCVQQCSLAVCNLATQCIRGGWTLCFQARMFDESQLAPHPRV